VLKTEAITASLLLLNDKFDPDWKVTVDGKPEPLLRCNFIMRGVALSAGPHTVEFRFEPPIELLYVSLATIAMGLVLLGLLGSWYRNQPPTQPAESQGRPAASRSRSR
jgi:uncharacterized membrane protein YfhO